MDPGVTAGPGVKAGFCRPDKPYLAAKPSNGEIFRESSGFRGLCLRVANHALASGDASHVPRSNRVFPHRRLHRRFPGGGGG